MKRKFAHLETKYDSLYEKIVDQENYNRRENLVFEGFHESRGENLQIIIIICSEIWMWFSQNKFRLSDVIDLQEVTYYPNPLSSDFSCFRIDKGYGISVSILSEQTFL